MKMETAIKPRDLSNVKGTYAKVINAHSAEIRELSEDSTVSKEDFIYRITLFVKEESKDTPARQNFLFNLNKQTSKISAIQLVYNALLRGSGLGVNPDDSFHYHRN